MRSGICGWASQESRKQRPRKEAEFSRFTATSVLRALQQCVPCGHVCLAAMRAYGLSPPCMPCGHACLQLLPPWYCICVLTSSFIATSPCAPFGSCWKGHNLTPPTGKASLAAFLRLALSPEWAIGIVIATGAGQRTDFVPEVCDLPVRPTIVVFAEAGPLVVALLSDALARNRRKLSELCLVRRVSACGRRWSAGWAAGRKWGWGADRRLNISAGLWTGVDELINARLQVSRKRGGCGRRW